MTILVDVFGVKGAKWEYDGKSHIFVRRENGGWENIVMWDKGGCCLPRALPFAIQIDKEVMEAYVRQLKL